MRSIILIVIYIASTAPSPADTIPAAGRVEKSGWQGTCSAVLIAPDLIMTAAHCIGDDPTGVTFRPSSSGADVVFPLSGTARHPLYSPDQKRPGWKIRFDIRIARLAVDVPEDVASPIPVGAPAERGEFLFLASWRVLDGPHAPQRACTVLDGIAGIVTLGCKVEGGESGAPVFRSTDMGLELVAIVSSRSKLGGQHVALATDAQLRLRPLLDALD